MYTINGVVPANTVGNTKWTHLEWDTHIPRMQQILPSLPSYNPEGPRSHRQGSHRQGSWKIWSRGMKWVLTGDSHPKQVGARRFWCLSSKARKVKTSVIRQSCNLCPLGERRTGGEASEANTTYWRKHKDRTNMDGRVSGNICVAWLQHSSRQYWHTTVVL